MVENRLMRVARTRRLIVLALAVAALATACRGGYRGTIAFTGEPKPTGIPQNIPDVLEADKDKRFTVLLGLVEKAGLGTVLEGTGPMTLFAPTDAAWHSAFSDADLAKLGEQTTTLKKLLQGHVTAKDVRFSRPSYVTEVTGGGTTALKVDGRTDVKDAGLVIVTGPQPLTMLDGATISIFPDKTIAVPSSADRARVVTPDLQAPNGLIQVVDKVLAKPAAPTTTSGPPTSVPGAAPAPTAPASTTSSSAPST
jgi:uncharacterized surface protein with fasciclin (FAS1) repeats